MRYYLLRQDWRIDRAISPASIDPFTKFDELAELSFTYLKQQPQQEYVDFLAAPPPMISDSLKNILEKHSPATQFVRLVLIDPETTAQAVYWAMRPPLADCLSPHTVFDPGKRVKKLVLDKTKLPSLGMFGIQGIMEPYIVVSLAATESILRRNPWGVLFERIEVRED